MCVIVINQFLNWTLMEIMFENSIRVRLELVRWVESVYTLVGIRVLGVIV